MTGQHSAGRRKWAVSGALAGLANGLFGGGGGMILVPLLLRWVRLEEKRAFASSVAIILPLCLVSAAVYWWRGELDWLQALPYLLGGWLGGTLGGKLFRKASPRLLRTLFALFLLYGGIRCLLF
ncbi:MAG: sulfite exporter TauE/SafE family protein [Clostridiales bacterium]|nr:sulfite exporter TauE/SafE family protein [Clostridiales bacterium]